METQRLAFHTGRAHKLALEPEAPTCFLSCGEDGAVRKSSLHAVTAAAQCHGWHRRPLPLLPALPDCTGAVRPPRTL